MRGSCIVVPEPFIPVPLVRLDAYMPRHRRLHQNFDESVYEGHYDLSAVLERDERKDRALVLCYRCEVESPGETAIQDIQLLAS